MALNALFHNQVHNASLYPLSSAGTIHQYDRKSRGRDYSIQVRSHARDAQYPPLLYFGEEIEGSVILLSLANLNDVEKMDAVVSQFVLQWSGCH